MKMKDKYLTLEEAARLINPKYKLRSIFGAMDSHIRKGNINPVYPMMAVVDSDGNVLQQIGPSEKPFFLQSEIEDYLQNRKAKNLKRGHQRPIRVVGNGIDNIFDSIAIVSEEFEINYSTLYAAICSGKEIDGYSFNKI